MIGRIIFAIVVRLRKYLTLRPDENRADHHPWTEVVHPLPVAVHLLAVVIVFLSCFSTTDCAIARAHDAAATNMTATLGSSSMKNSTPSFWLMKAGELGEADEILARNTGARSYVRTVAGDFAADQASLRTAIRELTARAELARKEGRPADAAELEQRVVRYRDELGSRP